MGFTGGNLVVSTVGDGSAALTSAGTAAFLKEFSTSGSLVASYALPTASNGSNHRFVNSGTATSELQLTRSSDGKYLFLAGYDAAVGTAGVVTTASATNGRVIARVSADGTIDTSTALSDAYSGNNIRSIVSNDGINFWTAGTASTGGGVRYTTFGSTTSTQLSSTITNTRVVGIYNNQLYVSSATGTYQGVSTVGTGLPTTSGQTISLLSGFPTTSGESAYDFEFINPTTLFVSDDRTNGSGGLQKWTLNAGTWTLATTYNTASNVGTRSLAYDSIHSIIYAITTDNKLVSFTEGGGFTTLAVGSTNTSFRGVEFAPTSAPVPEPISLITLGFGALAVISRRRRSR